MIAVVYAVVFGLSALFAAHRLWLLAGWLLARRPAAPARFAELPVVTVQLPVYDEREVVARLIDAACALDWPRDRLEVQVLDDSDDETTEIAAARVACWRAQGVDVVHLRRGSREGYKAGALAHGLARARGDILLVLDADFVAPADLLRRTVDWFTDPGVGMVQARWGHLNAGENRLTAAQAVLLDAHFVVENGARAAAGRFFNFSGTAGLWRRQAIDAAGGWQSDTLTEDMDLSYRAQLAGWRFVFLPDVIVPAELPATVAAFRGQQFRWAKGQTQVARKLAGRVLAADLPLLVKLDALFHLASNLVYPLLLALSVLWAPALASGHRIAPPLLLAVPAVFVLGFYAAARRNPLALFTALVLCLGLAWQQSRAVWEGLVGRQSPFLRTPKRGTTAIVRYQPPRSGSRIPEALLALGHTALAVWAVMAAFASTIPFAVCVAVGSAWMARRS